jgi:hypothetical protein
MNKSDPPTTYFGNYHHARWLTLANRALWFYCTTHRPNAKLKKLVSFIVNVYAPFWFRIKTRNNISEGSKLFFEGLTLVLSCPGLDQKDINSCKATLSNNSFYAHPEWILLAMLCDESPDLRSKAIAKIKKIREDEANNPEEEVRTFEKPALQWSASTFYEMIDWVNTAFFEPPLTQDLSLDDLEAIQENPLVLPNYPCHNQAVERLVKDMTETSQRVSGQLNRDAVMRNKIISRTESCKKKADYFK